MKKLISLLLAFVLVFSLVACSAPAAEEPAAEAAAPAAEEPAAAAEPEAPAAEAKAYKIGLLPQSLNDTFQVILSNAAQKYLEDQGCEVTVMAGTTYADVNSQMEYIETMKANGYDAILCSPMEGSAGIVNLFAECINSGMVVVNYDNSVSNEVLEQCGLNWETFPRVGTNNYDAAGYAAKYLMENYPQGVKVGMICGTDGSETNHLRTTGFTDVCGDYMELISALNADWEVEKAYTATQNMVTAHPEIEVIFCLCDSLAIGTYNALEEMGYADKIDVIGFDGTVDGLQAVVDGKFVCEIAQDVVGMGQTAAQLALDMLNGAPGKSTDMPVLTIVADNAAAAMEKVLPYSTTTAN